MPIIQAQDLICQRGQFVLFSALSFALDKSQSLLISGANGIGKTTLLESIAGLRAFSSGKFQYKDLDMTSNKDIWFDASFYIGHKTGNKKELNCLENLRFFLQIQGVEVNTTEVEEALAKVGLAGFEFQFAGNLSAGQKKRLALARLTLIPHTIWILDEPFVNLDIAGCDWLLNLLQQHIANGGILIITAHDNKAIRECVTQELILEQVQ
ncbi:MAG: cytochrome c biogenesis heme-transporting ATPase CcmA [Proteobacteria bacterium]|nr:cytochrome c biogenesis heme-transporting ATPase CcmA [Pseudomonadota bacterium]